MFPAYFFDRRYQPAQGGNMTQFWNKKRMAFSGQHGGHVHHRQRRRRHHGQPALTGVFGFAFLGGGESASPRFFVPRPRLASLTIFGGQESLTGWLVDFV